MATDQIGSAICMLSSLALVLGLIALVIMAARANARREQRRRELLRYWAAHSGWVVTATPAVDWGARLPGRNRRGVSLVVSGVVGGFPVGVGEYSVTETQVSSGADGSTTTTSHTRHYTVVVVRLPGSYPPVAVERRGPLSKIGRAMFGSSATATGNEQFDQRFRVLAPDPNAARHLVGPTLAAEHVAETVPQWSLYGCELLAYRQGRLDAPEHIPALAMPLVRVASFLGR